MSALVGSCWRIMKVERLNQSTPYILGQCRQRLIIRLESHIFRQMRISSLADCSPAHWATATGRIAAQYCRILKPAFCDNRLICSELRVWGWKGIVDCIWSACYCHIAPTHWLAGKILQRRIQTHWAGPQLSVTGLHDITTKPITASEISRRTQRSENRLLSSLSGLGHCQFILRWWAEFLPSAGIESG